MDLCAYAAEKETSATELLRDGADHEGEGLLRQLDVVHSIFWWSMVVEGWALVLVVFISPSCFVVLRRTYLAKQVDAVDILEHSEVNVVGADCSEVAGDVNDCRSSWARSCLDCTLVRVAGRRLAGRVWREMWSGRSRDLLQGRKR